MAVSRLHKISVRVGRDAFFGTIFCAEVICKKAADDLEKEQRLIESD